MDVHRAVMVLNVEFKRTDDEVVQQGPWERTRFLVGDATGVVAVIMSTRSSEHTSPPEDQDRIVVPIPDSEEAERDCDVASNT